MIKFLCEDCGCNVSWWTEADNSDPKVCFLCDWIRGMPENERQPLRDWLRLNPEEEIKESSRSP
jgi:hypothetical protein